MQEPVGIICKVLVNKIYASRLLEYIYVFVIYLFKDAKLKINKVVGCKCSYASYS